MTSYHVIKPETGETQIVECLFTTSWIGMKTIQGGNVTGLMVPLVLPVKEEGDWKSKLANKHSGWKEVLDGVKKAPGSNVKDLYWNGLEHKSRPGAGQTHWSESEAFQSTLMR